MKVRFIRKVITSKYCCPYCNAPIALRRKQYATRGKNKKVKRTIE